MFLVAFIHLSISAMPFSDKLARFILGSDGLRSIQNRLVKTANSLTYRISFVIFNLLLLYLTALLFIKWNIRLIDAFN